MKGKFLLFITVLILLSGFVFTNCAATTPAPSSTPTTTSTPDKVFKWKFQCVVSETDADWYVNMKGIKRLIEEGSGGRVQVEIFPAGVLVDPDSIVDATAKGAIDGGHIIAGMAADRVPSCLGSEMPFGTRDMYERYELHYPWGLLNIMREEYATKGLYLLNMCGSGKLCFQSTFPVNKVEDFNGKKIFAIPNCIWMTNLGAAPTEVPGMDMYMALKLGTIDGMTWTVGELEFAKFKEVVKYVMFPPLLTPTTHTLVNIKKWNELGPDLQRQIQDHIDAHIFDLSKEYETYDKKSLDASSAYGVKFITLSTIELAKMKQLAQSFWDEVAGMSPNASKMIDSYRAYLKYKETLK